MERVIRCAQVLGHDRHHPEVTGVITRDYGDNPFIISGKCIDNYVAFS